MKVSFTVIPGSPMTSKSSDGKTPNSTSPSKPGVGQARSKMSESVVPRAPSITDSTEPQTKPRKTRRTKPPAVPSHLVAEEEGEEETRIDGPVTPAQVLRALRNIERRHLHTPGNNPMPGVLTQQVTIPLGPNDTITLEPGTEWYDECPCVACTGIRNWTREQPIPPHFEPNRIRGFENLVREDRPTLDLETVIDSITRSDQMPEVMEESPYPRVAMPTLLLEEEIKTVVKRLRPGAQTVGQEGMSIKLRDLDWDSDTGQRRAIIQFGSGTPAYQVGSADSIRKAGVLLIQIADELLRETEERKTARK